MEEEVRRAVEQAKELQDGTAAHVARSSGEEQWIRQRTLVLDSSMRRLPDSIASQASSGMLDSKLAERVNQIVSKDESFPKSERAKELEAFLSNKINLECAENELFQEGKEEAYREECEGNECAHRPLRTISCRISPVQSSHGATSPCLCKIAAWKVELGEQVMNVKSK